MYHLLSDVTILLIRSTLRSQHCTPQLFFLAFWCTENCASWLSMSFLRCLNSELLRIMYIYIYVYLQITIENTWLSQSENDSQEDNQNFWQPFLEGSLDLLFLSHLSEFFFMPSHLSCKLIQSIVNHVFT